MNRAKLKPSKPVSAVSMVLGVAFFLIGLFFVIPNTAFDGFALAFGILWTLLALGGAIFHGINLFTGHGMAVEEIEFDSPQLRRSASQRLTELEIIKSKGFITEEEYQIKRNQILGSL